MGGGAWCPGRRIDVDIVEYLQIDLGRLNVITHVETQGRFGNGQVSTRLLQVQTTALNQMQSETADFAPVPPPSELDETYASSLNLAYTLHYMKT